MKKMYTTQCYKNYPIYNGGEIVWRGLAPLYAIVVNIIFLTLVILKGKVWALFCQGEAEPAWIFILVVGTNSPNDLQKCNKIKIMEIDI